MPSTEFTVRDLFEFLRKQEKSALKTILQGLWDLEDEVRPHIEDQSKRDLLPLLNELETALAVRMMSTDPYTEFIERYQDLLDTPIGQFMTPVIIARFPELLIQGTSEANTALIQTTKQEEVRRISKTNNVEHDYTGIDDLLNRHPEKVNYEGTDYYAEEILRELIYLEERGGSYNPGDSGNARDIVFTRIRKELEIANKDPQRRQGKNIGLDGTGMGKKGQRIMLRRYLSYSLAKQVLQVIDERGLIHWKQ